MSIQGAKEKHPGTNGAPDIRLPPGQKKRIYIGEVVASAAPLLLQTLLGSCVAVCLRDPVAGVGGMNHILLPGRCNDQNLPARGGVHAMELLINAIMKQGGDRRRLVAKAFGGANIVAVLQSPTVGEQNAAFVRDFLLRERIPLVAQRLGGSQAVQVRFRTDTGETIVPFRQRLPASHPVERRGRLSLHLRQRRRHLRDRALLSSTPAPWGNSRAKRED